MSHTSNTNQSKDNDYVQFVFFGRLDKEKGWDILLNVWEKLIKENKNGKNSIIDKTRFLIFGDGPYNQKVLHLASKSNSIKYFGWKNRDDLQRYIGASDYTLMTSLCMESFGLSALESLSLGVPAIGFKKGGLTPFILPELAIENFQGSSTEEKLYNGIVKIVNETTLEKKQQHCERASKLAYKYTKENWLKNFHKLIHTNNKQKKILLISDYASKLYGIESHIHSLKDMLEQNGYTVEIYGAQVRKSKRSKLIRTLLLPMTTFNILAARKIRRKINTMSPDIIRRHSTNRWLGWLPYWFMRHFKGQQRKTYHDLGYFHPYPHKTHQLEEIPQWNLSSYVKAAKTKNPIVVAATISKFLLQCIAKKYMKTNIDKHFVPSSYMLPITERRLGHKPKPKGKVMLLEHYLRDS